jgi:hypothetical protein
LDSLHKYQLNPSETLLDIDFDFFSTNNPDLHPIAVEFGDTSKAIRSVSSLGLMNYCPQKIEKFPALEQLKYKRSPKQHRYTTISNVLRLKLLPCLRNKNEEIFLRCSKVARQFWCKGEQDAKLVHLELHQFMHGNVKFKHHEYIIEQASMVGNLPYFIDEPHSIRLKMKKLKNVLQQIGLVKAPKLISLCRSETDGHTPKFLIEFLKNEIYEMLGELFTQ